MILGHGDDAYRLGLPVRANFSSNVRKTAHATALRRHLVARMGGIESYPPAAAEKLVEGIAKAEGVATAQIVATAGATGAIHAIAHAYRRCRSVVVGPTFSEYGDACALNDHRVIRISRRAFLEGGAGGADLVWICNPNNPTGEVFPRDGLLAAAAAQSDSLFVVDTAYSSQCEAPGPVAADIARHPNLVLVRSLTKDFGVPGLRAGYVAAARRVASRIGSHVPPWSVGALAQEAALFLLEQPPEPQKRKAAFLSEARRLERALGAIPGIATRPSQTGFFILETRKATAARMKRDLLRGYGLLVRDASNFHGLGERHVRVCTQGRRENRWLEEAIAEWICS